MKHMKHAVILALALAASPAFAAPSKAKGSPGVVTEQEITRCEGWAEVADLVYSEKIKGATKRSFYAASAKTPGTDKTRKDFLGIVNIVFDGVTPDALFEACISLAEES